MANQFPTVYPVGYSGNTFDFLHVKTDRSGAVRLYSGQVSIPTGTVVGTKIGIVPVLRGARVAVRGSCLWSDALGTGVTGSVGITYNPTSTQTEVPAQYVPANTATFAAGGEVALDQVESGLYYNILDSGWLTVTTGGATTTGTGVYINYNVLINYDFGALQ